MAGYYTLWWFDSHAGWRSMGYYDLRNAVDKANGLSSPECEAVVVDSHGVVLHRVGGASVGKKAEPEAEKPMRPRPDDAPVRVERASKPATWASLDQLVDYYGEGL